MCVLKQEHFAPDVYLNTHSMQSMHVISPTVCMHARVHTDVLFAMGALPVFFTLQKEGFLFVGQSFLKAK